MGVHQFGGGRSDSLQVRRSEEFWYEEKKKKLEEVIVDILCDVCHQATALEFGTLKAHWGYGSKHDGERYEVQLCETCFFYALTVLKTAKRDHHMFDE